MPTLVEAAVPGLAGAALLPQLRTTFQAAYRSAFDSLLDVEGVPVTIANHRSQEVLFWLQAHGVRFKREERQLSFHASVICSQEIQPGSGRWIRWPGNSIVAPLRFGDTLRRKIKPFAICCAMCE